MRQGHLRLLENPSAPNALFPVGAEELNELTSRWSAYQAVTDPKYGPLDPVAALHCMGAVLRAVEDVITTAAGRR